MLFKAAVMRAVVAAASVSAYAVLRCGAVAAVARYDIIEDLCKESICETIRAAGAGDL